MEMNGEEIIKKSKKTPKRILIGYVICIIAIIVASYVIDYRKETEKPEPIDFTTDGAMEMEADQYAYLDVQGLTYEVATYGESGEEYSDSTDRYYIAFNEGYMYLVDLNFETIEQLKSWQEYIYSKDENVVEPEPVKIYGMTESIPQELKKIVLDYYNEGASEENQISLEEFETYFGSVLLNVRKAPVDTIVEEMVIMVAVIGVIILVIAHITAMIVKGKVKKYLKKNGYEEEIISQLDNNVEEKHYKDKVILTKDFLLDVRNGGLMAVKYSDVKWVHIHNVKYYGAITVSSCIIVHLKDGKTSFGCVEIKGNTTEEFLEIFNKICEKVPADCLKGFTTENQKEFKQYKKELKRNGI